MLADLEVQNRVAGELESGERLLWSGRPSSRWLYPQDAVLIPFSVMWGGFAIFWEASALSNSGARGSVIFPLWGIPFVAMGLYMVIGRFFCGIRAALEDKLRTDRGSRPDSLRQLFAHCQVAVAQHLVRRHLDRSQQRQGIDHVRPSKSVRIDVRRNIFVAGSATTISALRSDRRRHDRLREDQERAALTEVTRPPPPSEGGRLGRATGRSEECPGGQMSGASNRPLTTAC